MLTPTYYLLHVTSPAKSADFYTKLFGRVPVETSPTFALFAFEGGIKVGLWSKTTVEPATGGVPGALEIGIALNAPADVDALHDDWLEREMSVLQPPTDMDFGRSLVVTDPDGHRIRVFAVTG